MGAAGTPTYKGTGTGGGGSGGTCADSPQLLCLAGRTGTTNDPLISTDAYGIVTGSGNADFGLRLRATTSDTTTGPGGRISLADNIAHVSGSWHAVGIGSVFDVTGASDCELLHLTGTFILLDSVGSSPKGLLLGPTVVNDDGVIVTGPSFAALAITSNLTARNAAFTLDTVASIQDSMTVVLVGGSASLSIATRYVSLLAAPDLSSAASVPLYNGLRIFPVLGAGTALGVGIDLTISGAAANVSLRSSSTATMQHAGAGVFGALGAETNTSVGLEVQSTTRSLLISRMTTAQKNALTAADGMAVYDTTLGLWQFREAGTWARMNVVQSVFGRTGAVVAASNDYTWAQIDKTTSSIADVATRTHSLLTSLAADDHTQYALLAGRAGGQTLIGGTAAGNNLTLTSTSNATKGSIFVGAGVTVDNAGSITAIGPTHNLGTAGTVTTLNVGQASTADFGAMLNIISGNTGTGIPELHLQRNGNDVLFMTAAGNSTFNFNGTLSFKKIDLTVLAVLTATGKFSTYNSVVTNGLGLPAIYSESISTTKVANFTAFSYTPPATAGRYRVSGVITTTSATNTGTVQFTLDYVDSQGTTHTADIIPLVDAAGAVATTKTGASKEFHSVPWEISINNSATAIALKVVITGTVSYTVAGTLEQIA